MKIRYYSNLNGIRWLGFILAMISVFILSNADVETQWIGWAVGCVSCFRDRDIPRTLMELCYLLLGLRAVWNWLM